MSSQRAWCPTRLGLGSDREHLSARDTNIAFVVDVVYAASSQGDRDYMSNCSATSSNPSESSSNTTEGMWQSQL